MMNGSKIKVYYTVNMNNMIILNKIKSKDEVYKSIHVETEDDFVRFPPEFLNTIEIPGLLPHRLILKKGFVVILL